MELRQLSHFVAVAEEGNFSVAARRVHLSQPALTRSIRNLEDHLETRLLDRTPQGAALTQSGELFLDYARMILNDCSRAREGIRLFREGAVGQVHIGIAAMFGGWIADEVVQRATLELPNLELTVTEGYFEDLLSLLRSSKLDFLLTNFAQPGVDDEFVFEPTLQLRALIFAAADHPLTRVERIEPADLAAAAWVVVDRAHAVDMLAPLFAGVQLAAPRPLRTNSLALIRSLVANGSHLTLVSDAVMHRDLQRGHVRALNVPMPVLTRQAGLIYMRDRPRAQAVERMMQIVRQTSAARAR